MAVIDNITYPNRRSRADQNDILVAFAERLRTHSLLGRETVIIDEQAVPEAFPAGGLCVVVAPGDGQFPQRAWESGHHSTATEEGSIVIGIYVMNRRDRPGRAESRLLGRLTSGAAPSTAPARPGLIALKREVLQLLTVLDPTKKYASQAWEPSKAGIPLCRSQPIPMHVTKPLDVPKHDGWVGIQLTFAVSWDWDLYSV